MAHHDDNARLEALSNFTHLTTSYKTVDNHPILVHVLLPKAVPSLSAAVPLFARFHGGSFVTGHAMYIDWIAAWNLHWVTSHSGVMVLPDHRLLPEANGSDMLEDLSDFWTWVATELQNYIDHSSEKLPIKVDLSRTIALGESAGGYFAIQSGFLAPTLAPKINIVGMVAPFPMLDLEDPWFAVADKNKNVLSFVPLPACPESVVTDHLAKITTNGPSVPVTAVTPPDRLPLMVTAIRYGYINKFLQGEAATVDEDCYPFRRLRTTSSFPPLFVMHGLQDSVVPVDGTRKFVQALKEQVPDAEVVTELHDGDHGFEGVLDYEKGWLGDGLKWIEKFGLAKRVE